MITETGVIIKELENSNPSKLNIPILLSFDFHYFQLLIEKQSFLFFNTERHNGWQSLFYSKLFGGISPVAGGTLPSYSNRRTGSSRWGVICSMFTGTSMVRR